jgi:peptidoglycan-associated lipoprotein
MLRSSLRPAAALLGALALALLAGCGPKYPKCEKDDTCAEKGEVCVQGQCQQCRDDSNCAAGQQCKGGRCEAKPECSADGDCADGKVCKSGKCAVECARAADCGDGMKCEGSRCVPECTADGDCAAGLGCVRGRCGQREVSNASTAMCMAPTVRFGYNEAALDAAAKSALSEYAACQEKRETSIEIEGHCDERGTEEYNLQLGEKRARAVEGYLKKLGIKASRLRFISKGELEPLDSAGDEDAWAKNRRAEFDEK